MTDFRFVPRLLDAFGLDGADPELLRSHDLGVLGDGEQGSLRRRHLRITTAVLREALRSIMEAFAPDIPSILLKGQPLEQLLFAGEYPRSTGDVDLLVLPGDMQAARRRLRRLGYRRKRNEAPRMWAHNQQPWVHTDHRVIVELHWSTTTPGTPQLPPGVLFDTREAFRFDDDLQVDVLRWDWLLFQLALHFHHHMGFAKGLVDIAGWIDRYGERGDETELLNTARRLGLFGIVQWPLHTLEALTGLRPPLLSDRADRLTRGWAKISATAMRNCLREPPRGEVHASLTTIMPRVGPARAVALQAATMLTLDGWPRKLEGVVRPLLLGPHRLGRIVHEIVG